jgi:hypothetical protein
MPVSEGRSSLTSLPLPAEAFVAARVEALQVDSLSLVRFDTNDYSVPTEFAHHQVAAVGTIDTVQISLADRVVATHRRCWGRDASRRASRPALGRPHAGHAAR